MQGVSRPLPVSPVSAPIRGLIRLKPEFAVLAAGLVMLLVWDASGLDLVLAGWFGAAHGFALRDAPWLFYGLHEVPRFGAWLFVLALLVSIWKPFGPMLRLDRAGRAWLAGTIVLSLLAVSLVKSSSTTSCPWDLQQFGGSAPYVSHWMLGVRDGGGGRCFPAGHASAAFAWMAGWFAFCRYDRSVARGWLAGAVAMGLLLGLAQQVRGAHYMSHTLWTAWICWAVACIAEMVRSSMKIRETTIGAA